MSGFLSRWARRKAAIRQKETAPPAPSIDLAALPPVDALDAASDFAVFLQAGVPAALQTKALRVAWETDAAIAGFRGMAEYDWDFNAAGYGRLAATDDVAALLRRIVAPAPPPEEVAVAEAVPEPPILVADADLTPIEAASEPPVAAQLALPRHGGALPS